MNHPEEITEPPEPPSCLEKSVFKIGRDSGGHWVAQEQNGLRGGLFINRTEALKFAKFESGTHPHAVVCVGEILELNTGFAPSITPNQRVVDNSFRQRRAA
jgi:hypothetical protein